MDWKVKNTGKGFNLTIFSLLSILTLISMIMRGWKKDPERSFENLAFTFLAFSPILILWIFIFTKFIFKKRIPIRINTNDDKFEFHFSDNKSYCINKNEFSYSLYEYKRYNVLVINKKMKSKRGHIINKELMSIVGLRYGIGWKKETVYEIAQFMKKSGIDYFMVKDKSFIFRIIQ